MSARQVKAIAARHDAEVFDDGDSLTVWTPPGTAWTATGCHSVSTGFRGAPRAQLWASLLADVRQGVQPCTQADCDGCEDQ
jgi:hypothetical protein